MNHTEAQSLAAELKERYNLDFEVRDFVPTNSIAQPYSYLALWVNRTTLAGTFNSRKEIDALRKVASIIFPVDEREQILKEMNNLVK